MSSASPVRLVFMGSDEITLPCLECLKKAHELVTIHSVYTQPDRARGRGKIIRPNAVKTWALSQEIPVFQPERFGEDEIAELRDAKPDLILVMAYGHLLPQVVLDIPILGIYNIHTSLLPDLRGASPIETAVATGRDSGASLMKLVMKMDAGPVCDQERVAMDPMETGGSYRRKLARASADLLKGNLSCLAGGSIDSVPQDEEAATYCRILVKQDGQLDYSQPAEVLARRINGLNPWPGCTAELKDIKLKVGAATWSDESCGPDPGQVLGTDDRGVRLATGRGVLNLLNLQKPGGKMLPVDVFLRGFPIEVGAQFLSREMHALISRKPVSHKRVFQLYRKP